MNKQVLALSVLLVFLISHEMMVIYMPMCCLCVI